MRPRTVIIGLIVFVLLWVFAFVRWAPHAPADVFSSDARDYSRCAVNLLEHGFYSLDGQTPFYRREPGMSLFLAGLYAVAGVENVLALFVVQGVLFFLAAWFFCREAGMTFGRRTGAICFFLLITHISVFHTVFSAYRECLALVLLMAWAGLLLSVRRAPKFWKGVVCGVLFGAAILTYFSFLFFLPVLAAVLWHDRLPWRIVLPAVLIPALVVTPWFVRNASYGPAAKEEAALRLTFMWYVRGEQAEKVRGLEPLRCLWSEYISRDWTGRSSACSFNGVKNARWPTGLSTGDDATVAASSKARILRNFFPYLWFSAVDLIELHLPYVGGGWSLSYNAAAAAASVVLYLGFLAGMRMLTDRRTLLFTALAGYNALFFVLTDATPRYLLPVLFCYTLVSAYGYDRFIARIRPGALMS